MIGAIDLKKTQARINLKGSSYKDVLAVINREKKMQNKEPKNDHKYEWTMHSKRKIIQYGLSANKIKRIIRFPDRKEEGIAPKTIAVMKRKSQKDFKKGEIWVMYQKKNKIKIISAWFYPTESPKGKEIFVPDDVWQEIESNQ